MKTFAQLMEQIHGPVDRTKVEIAKDQAKNTAERLRKRRQYQHGLHTTMHLNQTSEKEDRKKAEVYNA